MDSFFSPDLFEDPLMLWLSTFTVLLVITSLLLAYTTARFRAANILKEAKWRALEEKWRPSMFKVLSGDMPPEEFAASITPQEKFLFVDYLSRFAIRFSGEEKKRAERLAEPFLDELALRAAGDDPDSKPRALVTLGLLGPYRFVEVFLASLESEAPLTVLAAARTLAKMKNEEYMRRILVNLYRVESWSMSFLASLVAEAGVAAAVPCREIFADPSADPWLRVLAAESLRKLNDFDSADAAAKIVTNFETESKNVVCSALRLLHVTGAERHLEAVRLLWGHADPMIRVNAVTALGGLGTRDDRTSLRLMLHDDDEWVVWSAAWGLFELGDRAFLQDVVTAGHRAGPAAKAVLDEASAGISEPLGAGV